MKNLKPLSQHIISTAPTVVLLLAGSIVVTATPSVMIWHKEWKIHAAWSTLASASELNGGGGMKYALEILVAAKQPLWRINLPGANLNGADLGGAQLQESNLSGATLWWANLDAACLDSANLQSALLSGASLVGADMRKVDLSSADLGAANLSGSNLSDSILVECDFTDTCLNNVQLRGADLRGSRGLTKEAISSAFITQSTIPPDEIEAEWWSTEIEKSVARYRALFSSN